MLKMINSNKIQIIICGNDENGKTSLTSHNGLNV